VSGAPAPAPILEVSDLVVSYGAIKALKGISIQLMPEEIVTLIGANGAGKSTTLRAILGLVTPASGEIRFQGVATRARPPSGSCAGA
jgi:branched-chain amino acid transport system ATP-binding protein